MHCNCSYYLSARSCTHLLPAKAHRKKCILFTFIRVCLLRLALFERTVTKESEASTLFSFVMTQCNTVCVCFGGISSPYTHIHRRQHFSRLALHTHIHNQLNIREPREPRRVRISQPAAEAKAAKSATDDYYDCQ